jgi:hypothetical protein
MKEFGRSILDSISIIDNQQKTISYEGLAQRALEIDDPWLSLHAQLLADAAVFRLVAQKYPGINRDTIRDINYAIGWAFDSMIESEEYSLVEVISEVREALTKRAEELADAMVSAFSPIDVFKGLILDKKSAAKSLGFIRYANIEPYDFIKNKQDEATRAYVNAIQLSADAPAKAVAYIYQADLAVFESWLIAQSIAMDDFTYALASIRWALASASLSNLEGLPNRPAAAAKEIRKSLLWSVGPENAKSLRKYLMKF